MKNQSLTLSLKAIMLLLMTFTAISCNKDDEKDAVIPDGSNTVYNNQNYTIEHGFIQNGGPVDLFLDDEAEEKTHYYHTYILTDGTPTFEEDEVVTLEDGKIVISAVLLSPGTAGFKPGVFEYADWSEFIEADEDSLKAAYANKYFFPLAFVFTDTDSDEIWEDETGFLVTGGTFTVSGTAPNYTTEFDLTLEGGKKAKGKYSGNFMVVEE